MVFSGRKFIVVRDEPGSRVEALEALITEHGGELAAWDERADVDVSPKLVVVANSVEYDRSDEMRRFLVPTVTPQWVHACIEEGKLVPHRPYSPDPRNFLKCVIACFSGLSDGDAAVFEAGVRANGGDSSKLVTRYTSHVVALSLDTEECQLVLQSRVNNDQVGIRLVRPEWLDVCIKLQCLVDDAPYLLDVQSAASEQNLVGTFPVKDSPRLAVQQSVRESLNTDTLGGRRFYLASDLSLGEVVARTVKYLIETNGGIVERELDNSQVYLGRWREGTEYQSACARKLIVGNITWLYWVTIHQKFEKPTHLLHYPEVKNGLQSMRELSICITNYTGDARAYLQSLIHSIGATYSGKLIERHTTHLITAFEGGQKFEAAKKWNIPVLNHLWLEDSYAYWQRQDEENRLYTYFPPKLSLSTLVGARHLVPQALNREPAERLPHPKRQAKQRAGEWLHDAMIVEGEYLKKLRRGRLPAVEAESQGSTDGEEGSVAEPDAGARVHSDHEGASDRDSRRPSLSPGPGSEANTSAKSSHASPALRASPAPRLASERVSPSSLRPSPAPSPPSKKRAQCKVASQQRNLRIMFTGVDDPPSNKELNKLGISVVKGDPTIVVSPRFLKTAKFLQCLAGAQHFVTPLWVDACIAEQEVVPTSPFEIEDVHLQVALQNRAKLTTGLFDGRLFRLDPILKAKQAAFKDLVKSHGGSITVRPGQGVVEVGPGGVTFEEFVDAIQTMDVGKWARS